MNLRVRSLLLVGVALLLLGVAPVLADGPFRFHSITPCRLVDTREPPPDPDPRLGANTTRDFQVQGNCGVPVGAKAAFLNVTAVGPTSRGHLRLFPSGIPLPTVATLAFQGGEPAIANGAIVSLSANAPDLSVYTFFLFGGDNKTHLVLDVTGYFAPPPP